MTRPLVLLTVVSFLVGCSHSSDVSSARGLVLYTKGLSSDPYGNSTPAGFGVVAGIGTPGQRKFEIEGKGLGSFGGAEWLPDERMLVPRPAPPIRRPFLYRFANGAVRLLGSSPVPALEPGASWSRDGKLIASQPIEPCKKRQRMVWPVLSRVGSHPCPARRREPSASRRQGEIPQCRLVDPGRSRARDVRAHIRSGGCSDRPAVGSARPAARDGSLRAAARLALGASLGPIRLVTSPSIISMFAWSPVGHRLAYTTSGFPAPHELLVLDTPKARPRPLLVTTRHFDWITWSPDRRRLLLDDEHQNSWRLVWASGRSRIQSVPRLGGRPLWCCPVNHYATS